ncbi:unnamed protein product [Prunus armeniaca]
MLVDGATHNQMLSFMDGNAGYNQIMVAEEDIHKIVFMCPRHIGTFEYVVMPFGLRNAGATYQRAMNSVFHEMIGYSLDVYIEDVVIKSPEKENHVSNMSPPVLSPPKKGRPLKLYVSASSIGSLLVQDNKEGKEQVIYYLSRTLTEVERKYSAIERPCLALYFTAIKLRHYMLPFAVNIIANTELIKYMFTRPMLRGRIGKWTLALSEFSFRYVPQKAIKGQAVADFLADHLGEEIENMEFMDIANADLLTRAHTYLNNPIYSVHLIPWKLYFDGSKTDLAFGAGIVLEDPLGIIHYYSFQLDFRCTNNRAEDEALIISLKMLVELGIQSVEILGDSILVLKKIVGEYNEENFAANEMAWIAGVQIPEDYFQRIIKVWRKSLPSVLTRGMEIDVNSALMTEEDWRLPIINYLQDFLHIQGNAGHGKASRLKIKLLQSTPYYTQANGHVESRNKVILNIIRKMLEENPRQWHENLLETLWAYRTSKREATCMTPCAQTYGHDAILPMEITVQSIRISQQHNQIGEDYSQAMLLELEGLDTSRIDALNKLLAGKEAVARAYNERVKNKSFEEGEIFWRAILPLGSHVVDYGKWLPTWECPFLIKQVLRLGAYILQDQDGEVHAAPINGKWLKKFYPTMWDSQAVQTDPGIEGEVDITILLDF